jgi:seryl-tRNA synthetase
VHEFDKVELFNYCTPEQSDAAFADVLARAEGVLQALGLTYRVLMLCTGDLGTSSARTLDLEVFSPGVDRWLEVSSVSWFGDFQARRANVRYRTHDGARAHGKRFSAGVGAHLGGVGRDVSPKRRFVEVARGARALHGWYDDYQSTGVISNR